MTPSKIKVKWIEDPSGHRAAFLDFYWPDGTRFRRRMPDEESAAKLAAECEYARVSGTWFELRDRLERRLDEMQTFADLAELYWKDHVVVNNKEQRTARSRLTVIKDYFGEIPANLLTPTHIHHFRNKRKRSGRANRTINHDVTILSAIYNWAKRLGYVERNPAENIQALKVPRKRPVSRRGIPRPLTLTGKPFDEIIAKVEEVRPDISPVLLYLRHTGARLGEALALKHAGVDWDQRVCYAPIHKTDDFNYYPITHEVERALRALSRHPGIPWVFYRQRRDGVITRWHEDGTAIRKCWDTARNKLGHGWAEIHDLRRLRATEFRQMGVSPLDIAGALGHSSYRTTAKHYIHEDKIQSAQRLLKVIEGGKS